MLLAWVVSIPTCIKIILQTTIRNISRDGQLLHQNSAIFFLLILISMHQESHNCYAATQDAILTISHIVQAHHLHHSLTNYYPQCVSTYNMVAQHHGLLSSFTSSCSTSHTSRCLWLNSHILLVYIGFPETMCKWLHAAMNTYNICNILADLFLNYYSCRHVGSA